MNTPTANVGLEPCEHPYAHAASLFHTCSAKPVLLLLPIPRAVSFQVVLGECSGACTTINDTRGYRREVVHEDGCPARPVKVSCSIIGKTWPETEVKDAWILVKTPGGVVVDHAEVTPEQMSAVRARWALVKALVLGSTYTLAARFPNDVVDAIHRMHMQRDAVYAALCKMAMAEEALSDGANTILKICERKERLPNRYDDGASPSANMLRVYVGRLIEQVGTIGMAP